MAALAGGAAIAASQPQRVGPRGGPGAPGQRGPVGDLLGLRGIELTEAQREQVRAIMDSHRAEFNEAGTKLREAHRAFAEAVDATPVDESTVRARTAAIATAMADEAMLRAKARSEVQAILTPEQQEQLKQRRSEMEQRRQQRGPRKRQ
jgi:protein CpxP